MKKRLPTILLATSLLLAAASAAGAQTTRTVCASGCAYANLQTAINAAQLGDTLLLRAGETFTGNFTLPDKGAGTAYITIRSDASDASLPPAGHRIDPSYAPLLPKIRSGNSSPALKAAVSSHHYRLMFLELQANSQGFNDLLLLGAGDSSQNDLSLVPHDLIVDRVYVHGDPFYGQKRCIGLNSASTTIQNSYVSDCKGVGQDAQAIGSFNGPGPFLIENNYLEGSTENVLFGGSDPAIPNLVATGVTVRYNYMSKPAAWRQPILGTPQPAASASTTGGALAAGSYAYRVQAYATGYQGATYRSDGSAEVTATVSSGSTGAVTVTWPAVPNATQYRVYGRAAGAPSVYWTVTGTSFTDTGSGGTATASGPGGGTTWLNKNVFELKNAKGVTVYGNVIENSWLDGQNGYLVTLTPRNSSGGCTWCIVDDVEVSYNVIRHGAGGFDILGADDVHPSQRTQSLSIHDNLLYDVNTSWGASDPLFLIIDGPGTVTIDHNTTDHPNKSQINLSGSPLIGDLILTNNLFQRGSYGIFGDASSEGTTSLNAYCAAWTVVKNTIAGATASRYPADNFFPTVADWQAQFVDYANQDFHLTAASPYRSAGTDGRDLGADVDGVLAATAPALSGILGGPVAEAGGPYSGTAGQAVQFDGSRSTASSGSLTSYLWSFGDEVVLYAKDFADADLHGRWSKVSDASAAGGIRLENPDQGDAKISPPLASPTSYVEIRFNAVHGVPYHLWLRLRAAGDAYTNDSVSVQFSGTVDAAGNPIDRIGTTQAAEVVLEEGSGAGDQGWGWNDANYGALAGPVYFAADGPQTLRVQQREDGASFDQIVLSAGAYYDVSPGILKNDTTVVPKTLGTATGATASHVFRFPGTYPVLLVVTDDAGRQGSDTATATIQ
jgi:PKD domain-containing protein